MSNMPFYREQAARESEQADAAVLDNVRQRHLRAASAWTVLADRVEHTEALRAARETDKIVAEAIEDGVGDH